MLKKITILEALNKCMTTIKEYIGLVADKKVDKVEGKYLTTNDLTDQLVENYDTAYNHSQEPHAPSNAQKNSDITKAEIEAKLTGQIDTHIHDLSEYDRRLDVSENKLNNIEGINVEQNNRLETIENINQEYNRRLDVSENKIENINQEITNTIKPTLNAHGTKLNNIEAVNTEQNNRLEAIEIKNQEQDNRINALETNDKVQDINIKALFTTSDIMDIEEEGNSLPLHNSKRGFAIIDEIKGNTLVNCNKEPDKELILNGNINDSGDNTVTITEGVDGGLVDVTLEGNTLVNVSKTKDVTPITHESEDTTGNHIALADEGSMRPVLNGNTLVNVCDQIDPIAITKSYTVETGNHVALQGEYDGKCRPVVNGNTLVNLVTSAQSTNDSILEGDLYSLNCSTDYPNVMFNLAYNLQPGKTYTIIVDIKGLVDNAPLYIGGTNANELPLVDNLHTNSTGLKILPITIPNDKTDNTVLPIWAEAIGVSEGRIYVSKPILLEGDYTNKPIPGYFEGLQSSFEDKVVTQEMVDTGEEVADNLGKYRVEYKVIGKNKLNETSWTSGTLNTNTGVVESSSTHCITPYIWMNAGTYRLTKNTKEWVMVQTYDRNFNFLGTVLNTQTDNVTFTLTHNCYIRYKFDYTVDVALTDNIMVEEGSTATSYEPYKEYKKTFYLNSPLLEGDTIEQQGNNVVHVHRYKETVFDGSDDENWAWNALNDVTLECWIDFVSNAKLGNEYVKCDSMIPDYQGDYERIFIGETKTFISINKTKASNVEQFKQWLQQNPVTVVYKLNTPQYEVISQNDTILCDSYVNGHLDVDSVVPVEKVNFDYKELECRYLYSLSNYVIQFESDNAGIIDKLSLGGHDETNLSVSKGLNKFYTISGNRVSNPYLDIHGIGFNASNIVVTPAIEQDFDYFSGMQSCFEDNLVTEGENAGKYEVTYKVTGKNKFNDVSWMSGSIDPGTGEEFPLESKMRSDYIPFFPCDFYLSSNNPVGDSWCYYYDRNKNLILSGSFIEGFNKTAPKGTAFLRLSLHIDMYNAGGLQLEEGTEATTYEPYKEHTKTLYLNSPLLEGDTIEQQGDNVVHAHRSQKYTLNGTETGWQIQNGLYFINDKIGWANDVNKNLYCDKYPTINYGYIDNNSAYGINQSYGIRIHLQEMNALNNTVDELKAWLSNNPLDIVCTLDSPTYEVISENDTILCDSYVNGHLDVDSVVPIKKVDFLPFEEELTYLYSSTQYAVQFVSDAVNKIDITLGGAKLLNQDVVVGTNKYMITTPSELVDNKLIIDGVGANIKEVVVTDTDRDFGYFEGMKSVGECEELAIRSANSDNSLSNTQQLTHEQLRAVGNVKDRYVLIDGKWCINRKCGIRAYQDGDKDNYKTDLVNTVYPLETPTYEEIEYNPFEVYSEVTHITTNSVIPTNITVKNTGFNCLLKPNTTYTISSNLRLNTVTTGADIGDSCLRFYDTDTSDVTTMRDVLVLEGDWTSKADLIPGFFAGMESCYEQKKITDEHDEHFGYYEVTAKVTGKNLLNQNLGVYNAYFGANTICFPVLPNTTYTYSSSVYKDGIIVYECTKAYSNEGVPPIGLKHVIKSYGIEDGTTFTTSSMTKYIFMNYDAESNVQIEQGNTATEYEPYKENNIKFYINEPLRGIRDVKDRVYVKDDKVVIQRNCGIREYQDGDFGTYLTDKVNTVYPLAEPTYEEVEYIDSKLYIEIFKNSTLFYNSNVPISSKLHYTYSIPLIDKVSQTANISDQQDSMIIDLATQCAVMEIMLM